MDSLPPKAKTIRIMLQETGEQQNAIFRMAFKMHNTTNYRIITPNSGESPDMIIVDTDTNRGLDTWRKLKSLNPNIPVVMFSSREPLEAAPYLAKPIKFDTLFPILRGLSQGAHIFNGAENINVPNNKHHLMQPQKNNPSSKSDLEKKAIGVGNSIKEKPRRVTIHSFNPKRGILGALKNASEGHQDVVILHNNKPILIVFPSTQRVLLAVNATELEKLSKDDHLSVISRPIADNPLWKEKAKVTIMSCLWQVAIWTAKGRLIYPMTPQTVFTLKCWPNLTRLAPVPESMRLSAFLTKTSVNLHVLYKVMLIDMPDILNYLSATFITGFLATDEQFISKKNERKTSIFTSMDVDSDVPDNQMAKEAQKAAGPSGGQSRSLLQNLMHKLLSKL